MAGCYNHTGRSLSVVFYAVADSWYGENHIRKFRFGGERWSLTGIGVVGTCCVLPLSLCKTNIVDFSHSPKRVKRWEPKWRLYLPVQIVSVGSTYYRVIAISPEPEVNFPAISDALCGALFTGLRDLIFTGQWNILSLFFNHVQHPTGHLPV